MLSGSSVRTPENGSLPPVYTNFLNTWMTSRLQSLQPYRILRRLRLPCFCPIKRPWTFFFKENRRLNRLLWTIWALEWRYRITGFFRIRGSRSSPERISGEGILARKWLTVLRRSCREGREWSICWNFRVRELWVRFFCPHEAQFLRFWSRGLRCMWSFWFLRECKGTQLCVPVIGARRPDDTSDEQVPVGFVILLLVNFGQLFNLFYFLFFACYFHFQYN